MVLGDELVDAALMVRGIREPREAAVRVPFILGKLRRVGRVVRKARARRRRMPAVAHALDWAWRSVMDASIDEAMKAEILAVFAEVKGLVGPLADVHVTLKERRTKCHGPCPRDGPAR
jgi:hypothetical protein